MLKGVVQQARGYIQQAELYVDKNWTFRNISPSLKSFIEGFGEGPCSDTDPLPKISGFYSNTPFAIAAQDPTFDWSVKIPYGYLKGYTPATVFTLFYMRGGHAAPSQELLVHLIENQSLVFETDCILRIISRLDRDALNLTEKILLPYLNSAVLYSSKSDNEAKIIFASIVNKAEVIAAFAFRHINTKSYKFAPELPQIALLMMCFYDRINQPEEAQRWGNQIPDHMKSLPENYAMVMDPASKHFISRRYLFGKDNYFQKSTDKNTTIEDHLQDHHNLDDKAGLIRLNI